MKSKTRMITLCAMFTALTVIFMYIGTVFPTGRIGFMAVASLFSAAAVIHFGVLPSVYIFAVSSVIGFLILPDKSPLMFYIFFFGYYPAVKSAAERINKHAAGWGVKLAVFNAALTVMFVFFKELLMLSFLEKLSGGLLAAAVYLIFNAVFVLYDIGLSRLIGFYIIRIHSKLK